MHNSKAPWFRAIIFVIVFIMINYVLTFVVVPKGDISRMTMREMYSQAENIDVVFAGASLSQRDINPYIMIKNWVVRLLIIHLIIKCLLVRTTP